MNNSILLQLLVLCVFSLLLFHEVNARKKYDNTFNLKEAEFLIHDEDDELINLYFEHKQQIYQGDKQTQINQLLALIHAHSFRGEASLIGRGNPRHILTILTGSSFHILICSHVNSYVYYCR